MTVTVKVQKWGNSLAVRIPSKFAEQVNLQQGTEIEMTVRDNQQITIKPKRAAPSLDELLSEVTEENRHNGMDMEIDRKVRV